MKALVFLPIALGAIAVPAWGQSAEHRSASRAQTCDQNPNGCRIADGALTAVEGKAPMIGIVTNAAAIVTSDGKTAADQIETGGKVIGLIKSGVETTEGAIASGPGRRFTGLAPAQVAAIETNAHIGGNVLGFTGEVVAFCADAARAIESCQEGKPLDASEHLANAVAGAAANAIPGCGGSGSACAGVAIGLFNRMLDDPELTAAQMNSSNNPEGTLMLGLERSQAREAADDAMDGAARLVRYRRNGGTAIEAGLRDSLNGALSGSLPSSQPTASVEIAAEIDKEVTNSVNEVSAGAAMPIEGSGIANDLADRTAATIDRVGGERAAVNSSVASSVSYHLQSSSALHSERSVTEPEHRPRPGYNATSTGIATNNKAAESKGHFVCDQYKRSTEIAGGHECARFHYQ